MTIRRRGLSLAAVPLLGLWLAPARAVEPLPPPDRAAKETELKGVETNLKATEAEQRQIEADVEAIKLDRGRLNQALLDTTARLQKIEADRADATQRLEKAGADAISLEASFGARRERIAELLAALQRMTHDAPPAIFVRPDDMAAAVRAAGVVNAMIGDVKAEADALSRDLARASALEAHDRRPAPATGGERRGIGGRQGAAGGADRGAAASARRPPERARRRTQARRRSRLAGDQPQGSVVEDGRRGGGRQGGRGGGGEPRRRPRRRSRPPEAGGRLLARRRADCLGRRRARW